MLPSLTSSKKFCDGPTCRLAIETTSRRLARMIWFFVETASSYSRSIWSIRPRFGRVGSSFARSLAALYFR